MNIEFLEFYPQQINAERGLLNGTLRIRLPDIRIQILGIFVSKSKKKWYFALPGRKGIDETGEDVRYSAIIFEDEDERNAFYSTLKEKGPVFIEQFLEKNQGLEKDLIKSPAMRDNASGKVKALSDGKIETATRKKAIIEKMKPRHNLPGKTWVDVPPRKSAFRKKAS